ncbi:hypothetical protein CBR_g2698 [Chara braunii]|uniref:Integrase zinc-binding domain-containing protein n=1 Tax=Chara braunii TaxID=69332 RepID=A0A388KDR3_CHABU|nr:hypothetical protein CBR_g2698 [Chara braunii]|eukprot:GBG68147.1 hypothetical protein CBR_g2698 [Chara braunii]
MGRPLTPPARLVQAARTRNQARASASQEPLRREQEPGKRKEAMKVEDDDNEEEEDERLRREEDQRAEQRERKKGARGEAEPVIRDGPPKRKKYAVRLEEGFDVEKVIDLLLEGHNDLMTLKEILALAPRLLDELKGRLSWRLVPNVHLGTILPKEAEWAESGTKMDWECVACGTVDLVVKGSKCAAMVDSGAEMNIIREADAIRFRLDIGRSNCGILHGASCKAVFCGTASNVLIEVGKEGEAMENTPPVDEFLDQEEDVRLHINKWSPRVPSCVGYPIWQAPNGYERRAELVLKPFEEEDPWGSKDVQWMVELALANSHSLVEDVRAIEEGPGQVEGYEDLMGGIYLLVNTLLQEGLDQSGSLNPTGNVDEVPKSKDDEFEEGEIKEAFRAEEYDGIYLELGLLLSCEMWLRNVSDRAQRMLQRYLMRDGHLFVRREVGNPRRVVCGRNRQIDVVAALHDGIAGGHRGVQATYAKISELYYWDGMMDMVGKFCRFCIPCQERSRLRQGEPLHPRLEREVGVVVHLDLLFMPLGDQGYNYIFGARDNLSGFVDGRAIRTKTGLVLVSCIEEYYLRYPFVREFVMDKGSEFTCQEVQELLSRSDFTKTAMPRGGKGTRPPRRPMGASREYEQHGPRHRESTPVYDDGDIELFLNSFWNHARRMGWTVAQAIERLRGAGRFDEPITRILREATTRQEVETRMHELRPSPVRPDGRPIRLEIGNAADFIPAFEWFMQGHLAAYALEHPDLEEPARAEPRQEPCQPDKEMEAEIPKRVDLRTRERAPAGETTEEKRARRTRRIDEIWQERQRLEAAGELPEQQQERQRSEAAGALPGQPPSAPARAPEIPEMWRDFWEQRGEEFPSPVRAGFGVARKAEERLDRKIKFLAKTTFDRHLLLESDLAGKKMKALVASQAAIIESLRQQTQGKVDKPESSRQGEQRQPGRGLPGQPSAAEPRQEPPMGRVILEPEEARAQRQAEKEVFEFRAPTELATLPVAAVDPVVEEGLPPSSSEPAQDSAEGSMGVLLEAVHTMQEDVSLFSPEQRIEKPLEREIGIEAEGAIESGLQRMGTPEYGPEEIEEQPMEVPGETLERRPQRLNTPEYVPVTGDLRSRLGSWATGSGFGGPVPGTEQ